ncbi:Apolipoprotein N-acyltransferase [Candidatus Lokiarchaeum ossiferum]|uniref:Apolipoprotein N-acyltransferase n=1 Tax=Candidatus Lokiarchaeum ossiferum TaxID=2951803 RepID=A0ABY6HPH0_9ARCH|nr:Apolipoprotein N-acyltransferase [Candidatus Lokiarchaeum sp. B-35]
MSKITNNNKQTKNVICLLAGAFVYTFVGWHWNISLAAWISIPLIMCYFRSQDRFLNQLLIVPVLSVPGFLKMVNGWDMELYLAITIAILAVVILVFIPLIVDKILERRFSMIISSFIFPSMVVLTEFLLTLTPLGTGMSLGATQFDHQAILQVTSLTGIWGLSFLISWTASIINKLWEQINEKNSSKLLLAHSPLKVRKKLIKVYSVVVVVILTFGTFRLALFEPRSETVRIASISVPHKQNYWGEIVDQKTPTETSTSFKTEFVQIEEQLFNLSQKAVDAGAKIVFWSEGNDVFYEDQEDSFLNRCKQFAATNQIYFIPAVLKLYYGSYVSDNMAYMITPEGEIAFDYIKTISWYETTSDGIIDYIDTIYGRISITICFDNDFPNFIRQAGKNNVDILLVPAFDTEVIKDYHTKSSMIRGVENGMSVIRQSNTGVSMGIDYYGNILSYQDFFKTNECLMFTDLPTNGIKTGYSFLGDWLVYISLLFISGLIAWSIFSTITFNRKLRE